MSSFKLWNGESSECSEAQNGNSNSTTLLIEKHILTTKKQHARHFSSSWWSLTWCVGHTKLSHQGYCGDFYSFLRNMWISITIFYPWANHGRIMPNHDKRIIECESCFKPRLCKLQQVFSSCTCSSYGRTPFTIVRTWWNHDGWIMAVESINWL